MKNVRIQWEVQTISPRKDEENTFSWFNTEQEALDYIEKLINTGWVGHCHLNRIFMPTSMGRVDK